MQSDVPMFSIGSEQSVLGALMLDGSRVDDVADELAARDFYDNRHGTIFAAIVSLAGQGKPVDIVAVADVLQRRSELDQVGDMPYLAAMLQNTPSAANVMRYTRIVAERSMRRRVLAAGQQLADEAREAEDIDQLVGASLDALSALQADDDTSSLSAIELCKRTVAQIDHRYSNPDEQTGIPTGFAEVDKRLHGGYQPGDLVIIAGRPGMGKTVYAMNIADHVAANVGTVLVHSLEMSEKQLGERQLASASGVSLDRIMSGQLEDDDWTPLAAGVAKVSEYRQQLDFRPGVTVQQIRAKARRMKRQGGLTEIVVDYLTLMTMPDGDNQNLKVGLVTKGLKQLAKEFQVPVIVLCQLNRDVEKRANKRPMLSDLRDSGAIEQDADIIQFLYRDEYYDPDTPDVGVVEIITAKYRQGQVGTDRLIFQGHCSRMKDLDMSSYRPRQREVRQQTASQGGFD